MSRSPAAGPIPSPSNPETGRERCRSPRPGHEPTAPARRLLGHRPADRHCGGLAAGRLSRPGRDRSAAAPAHGAASAAESGSGAIAGRHRGDRRGELCSTGQFPQGGLDALARRRHRGPARGQGEGDRARHRLPDHPRYLRLGGEAPARGHRYPLSPGPERRGNRRPHPARLYLELRPQYRTRSLAAGRRRGGGQSGAADSRARRRWGGSILSRELSRRRRQDGRPLPRLRSGKARRDHAAGSRSPGRFRLWPRPYPRLQPGRPAGLRQCP